MIPGDKCIKKFSVENTSSDEVSYNIYMQEITNDFGNELVYVLKQGVHHAYFLENDNVYSLIDDDVERTAKCVGEFNTGEIYRTKKIILNCSDDIESTGTTSSTGATGSSNIPSISGG